MLVASLAGALGLALASRGEAAYPTEVLSAAERDRALPEVRVGVDFARTARQARILREWFDGERAIDVRELDYEETTEVFTITARVGIFRGLELTIAAPIVLAYESSIAFAENVAPTSTVYGPATPGPSLANDPSFASRYPITRVPALRARGGWGDLRFGLGWAVVDEQKHTPYPSITLRGEVTTPTGEVWDPADPSALPGGAGGSVGRGQVVLDVSLAASKRTAPGTTALDPYIVLGGRLPMAVGEQVDRGLEPPPSGRLEAGAEIIFYEPPTERVRYALDLGILVRYVASGRTYSVLSDYLPNFDPTRIDPDQADVRGVVYDDYANPDNYSNPRTEGSSCSGVRFDQATNTLVPATPGVPCGELTWVDDHLELGAKIVLHLQPTPFTLLRAGAGLNLLTDHLITGESVGRDTDEPSAPANCVDGACFGRVNARNARGEDERSRFYDPRYDAPGRRFLLEDAFGWSVFVDAAATF